MTPTRAHRAEATRQAALTAARTLFVRQGYDATSLQAIADEMGVTKANVYYYFRTKAEILEALLAPMADALDRLLDAAERLPHGDQPTPDQAAGFWLAQDLGPVLRRLTGLDDDELRDVLTRLCRRLWMTTDDGPGDAHTTDS